MTPGNRVLIIDDDPRIARLFQTLLAHDGFECVLAPDGQTGIGHLESDSFIATLIDMVMPGVSGLKVLEHIRTNNIVTVPVVVSGETDTETVLNALQLGAFDYLTKPVKAETLKILMHRAIRHYEALSLAVLMGSRAEIWEATFDASPDAMLVLDGHLTIRRCNAQAGGRLGRAKADLAGAQFLDVCGEDFLPPGSGTGEERLLALAGRTIERHLPQWGGHFEVALTPVRDSLGFAGGYVLVGHDITERRLAEEKRALMESQLRLAQKLESIGQLAAGIAHEINTPIQYVGDNAQFLRGGFADILRIIEAGRKPEGERLAALSACLENADFEFLAGEIPGALDAITDGLDRVANIVSSMKSFSHPGNEKTQCDLNKAVEATVTVARNEWKYVADMEIAADPALPPVTCLPGEVNQAILNIVVNAAHAIAERIERDKGEKGRIRIATRLDGDMAEISIADNGGGIPESARLKIFDPFFTTKGVGKGTGQGLAIAHAAIVEKQGGELFCETEEGVGTTFFIRLPVDGGTRG